MRPENSLVFIYLFINRIKRSNSFLNSVRFFCFNFWLRSYRDERWNEKATKNELKNSTKLVWKVPQSVDGLLVLKAIVESTNEEKYYIIDNKPICCCSKKVHESREMGTVEYECNLAN